MRTLAVFICLLLTLSAAAQQGANPFPVRGLCISVPESKDADRFADFIEKELAPRNVNTLVLMVNYNYRFESHPEMADPEGITKHDARKIARVCRKNGIEIIPSVNLLGHQSWGDHLTTLLLKHPEFDETPRVQLPEKYVWPNADGLYCKSYCPRHPDVHAFIFDLLDEVCDAFDANALHAGMDEVFYIGESQCPRCGGMDKSELFAGEVTAIHDHLALSGRKMWMWGDRLLDGKTTGVGEWEGSCNDTYRAIDMIPKDIVICDWHYITAELTPVYFAAKGFSVVACPWLLSEIAVKQARNTVTFRQSASAEMKNRFLGVMETVWYSDEDFMDGFGKEDDGSDKYRNVKCFLDLFNEINTLKY